MTNANKWLNDFSRNVTSTCGEDGILEKILEVISDTNRWCVEFGAADGYESSNTYNLIKNKNYSAVLIEANRQLFNKLQKNYRDNKNILLFNAVVGFESVNRLDAILKSTMIPHNFDVLSIDIDGNDYHVWETIKYYRPKVVMIEFNPTISNSIEFVQPRNFKINQGSSLLSIWKLAKQKEYELCATTFANAFFVDKKYFSLFNIKDSSVNELRSDESAITYIFCGYDGTIFLSGCKKLIWHFIPYNEFQIQQIPKILRSFPPAYGKLRLLLAGFYFAFFRKADISKDIIKKTISKLFSK